MESIKRFDTSMTSFGEINNGFIRATINIFTKDQVANGFEFQEEGIEKRRKNWAYVPVVAEYMQDKEDMGSHGGKLTISDNGIKYERTTIPMGVAIADTDRYEDVVCANGETKRYFCMDVYLWHDQFEKELDMFLKGESRPQSMEVKILNSEFVDGVEKVYDFEPLAMCILGVDIPPAFKDSKVKTGFQSDEFKANFDKMMFALDKYIESYEKGGDDVEEEIKVEQVEEIITEEVVAEVEVNDEVQVETETEAEVAVEVDVESEVVDTETQYQSEVEVEQQDEFAQHLTQQEKDDIDSKLREYESLAEKYSKLEKEYKEISDKYQAKVDAEELAKKQEIIASYSDSLTEEEMGDVVKDINVFSVEDVDVRLAALLGKKIKQEKASQKETSVFSNLNTNFSSKSKWDDWLKKMN